LTPRATRKFAYLRKTHEVSPLIDNRSNEITDIYWVMGESVAGMAEELAGEERDAMRILSVLARAGVRITAGVCVSGAAP